MEKQLDRFSAFVQSLVTVPSNLKIKDKLSILYRIIYWTNYQVVQPVTPYKHYTLSSSHFDCAWIKYIWIHCVNLWALEVVVGQMFLLLQIFMLSCLLVLAAYLLYRPKKDIAFIIVVLEIKKCQTINNLKKEIQIFAFNVFKKMCFCLFLIEFLRDIIPFWNVHLLQQI